MSELTELEKKLVEKARTVSQDKDFFLAVLNYADTEEDQQAIIDYIDKGQDVNEQNTASETPFIQKTKTFQGPSGPFLQSPREAHLPSLKANLTKVRKLCCTFAIP